MSNPPPTAAQLRDALNEMVQRYGYSERNVGCSRTPTDRDRFNRAAYRQTLAIRWLAAALARRAASTPHRELVDGLAAARARFTAGDRDAFSVAVSYAQRLEVAGRRVQTDLDDELYRVDRNSSRVQDRSAR